MLSQRTRTRQQVIKRLLIAFAVFALVGTCCSCEYYMVGDPPVRFQGPGLPTLRHLDWGWSFFHPISWSPDGRWIVGTAGDDYATSIPWVTSPDGGQHYLLSPWFADDAHCVDIFEPTMAWRPDGRLSCLYTSDQDNFLRVCTGVVPFSTCGPFTVGPTIMRHPHGFAWLPDASALLATGAAVIWQGNLYTFSKYDNLYLISPTKGVEQNIDFPDGGIEQLAWVPGAPVPTISYVLGGPTDENGLPTAPDRLATSTISWDAKGHLVPGPPQILLTDWELRLQKYAWSPSGRWIAARTRGSGSDGDVDRIYLLNARNPAQTLDVVRADKAGLQMTDPIWSPDGQTLIVFTVRFGSSQPYAIDIASYLKSKRLEP